MRYLCSAKAKTAHECSNNVIQTFRLISFGNYFCIFQRLVCENRSFLSDSHNFGLVSGKVIYDIVLDALIQLVFVGKREQVLC